MRFQIPLYRLQLLAPIHIRVGEVQMRLRWSSPRLICVGQSTRPCLYGRNHLPQQQSRKSVGVLRILGNEIRRAARDQNVQHREHRKQVPVSDTEVRGRRQHEEEGRRNRQEDDLPASAPSATKRNSNRYTEQNQEWKRAL